MGTVERIGLKTTRIRSLSGELLIFANHDLVNSRVRNYKTLQERRIVMKFGVTYETPLDKLRNIPQIVRGVFAGVNETRLDRVHFSRFGDFSLDFEVVYFVLTGDYTAYMNVQQEANLSLMEQFGKEGIDFAYPTQTLYFNKV
jgi:small-conductance mechanosensitive channel